MPAPYPAAAAGRRGALIAMTGLAGDRALVAEALAVVGLLVAHVLGAVLGVADVAQPATAGEIRAAGGLVEQAQRVEAEDLGAAAVQSRDGQGLARIALLGQRRGDQALHDRLPALHTDGERRHALAEDEQEPGANPVDGFAEDRLAAGRGLAEGAHDASDAFVFLGGNARPVVALAGRHVEHSQKLSQVHARSVKHAGRRDGSDNPCGRIHTVPVSVCDVGPRDGLQNDKVTLEPAVRAQLCARLAQAGLTRIEAASFVHPKLVPQMAGAEEVFAHLPEPNGTVYASLVLNRKGLDRALATTTNEIHVAYPVTDTFARRNQNTTVEEGARTAEEIIGASDLKTTATLSVAFGCPFEGHVDPGRVIEHAHRMAQAGADEVILADTIGVGVPRQVKQLVPEALKGGKPVGLHLHNTRNTGYANALAGLEHGATILDASVGGLGGCPFAPRATGNIATEDLIYLLRGEGVETGVDLGALLTVSEWLSGVLGRERPGLLQRAGAFPG